MKIITDKIHEWIDSDAKCVELTATICEVVKYKAQAVKHYRREQTRCLQFAQREVNKIVNDSVRDSHKERREKIKLIFVVALKSNSKLWKEMASKIRNSDRAIVIASSALNKRKGYLRSQYQLQVKAQMQADMIRRARKGLV